MVRVPLFSVPEKPVKSILRKAVVMATVSVPAVMLKLGALASKSAPVEIVRVPVAPL